MMLTYSITENSNFKNSLHRELKKFAAPDETNYVKFEKRYVEHLLHSL